MGDSFKKRKQLGLLEKRNNFYLVFGEGDKLPGLFIQYLNGEILIQLYTHFWNRYEDMVVQTIIKQMDEVFELNIFRTQIWKQMRVDGDDHKAPAVCFDPNLSFKNIEVKEFGVKYKVSLGNTYDPGLYTDMSSVRSKLEPIFSKSKKVLNLYCYTGAFSLYALEKGAEEVVSVDLSDRYLDWLEENLLLNPNFDESSHTSMPTNSLDGLKKLKSQKKTFDFVICDPPTSSSDGQKRTNALKEYEKLLPAINDVLEKDGKAVVFLNTHKINRRKFQQKIQEIIQFHKLPMKTSSFYGLGDDCPVVVSFPEGCYLKGILIQKGDFRPNANNSGEVKKAGPKEKKINRLQKANRKGQQRTKQSKLQLKKND